MKNRASACVSAVLDRLQGVKRAGNGWSARCLAHDDQRPSLTVSEGSDGRVLLKCHAGCTVESIVRALGLSMRELFPGKEPNPLCEVEYDYVDEQGNPLFQVLRRPRKVFVQRRRDGQGDWIWNLKGVERVLYNLPALCQANPGTLVFVVEGEKDVETLRGRGLLATTKSGGVDSAWLPQFNRPLLGKRVVVIPDNDDPGRRGAERVLSSLRQAGIESAILELPGSAAQGDVTDWLQAGGNAKQLEAMAEQVLAGERDGSGGTADEADTGPLAVPASEASAVTAGGAPRKPLWQQWVVLLIKEVATLIWTDTHEPYFHLPSGEVLAVYSDAAALYFQKHTERDAYYRSDKWSRAAGGLRSWIKEHGTTAKVFRQARLDRENRVVWIGPEDGKTLYRVTPDQIERRPNGVDGVLIVGGCAPVLELPIRSTGELVRWLEEDTWATPVAKLTIAICGVMMTLGAGSFDARPLVLGVGPKGSGKTTCLRMLGTIISGEDTIAQKIKWKEEQNESRIVNERLTIFDNLDAVSHNLDVADFLAWSCTSGKASIRRMRVEGEVVEKAITAFVAATSFSLPNCLKRGDVIDRALVLEFEKPKGACVARMSDRVPDRKAVWCDLLLLLQRALRRWGEVPSTGEHRSIEFIQFAFALLPADGAAALEQSLLALQASTAGLDDPILQKLEAAPPPRPMTADDLLKFWWSEGDPDRPVNARELGYMLRNKADRLGDWKVTKVKDEVRNVTVWGFERGARPTRLSGPNALALLRGLLTRDGGTTSGDGMASPEISDPSPMGSSWLYRRSGDESCTNQGAESEEEGTWHEPTPTADDENLTEDEDTLSDPSPDLRYSHDPGTDDAPEIPGDGIASPATGLDRDPDSPLWADRAAEQP